MSPPGLENEVLTACRAPSAALYFEPDGRVKACCATGHVAGQVHGPRRQSLRTIWEGVRLGELRSALAKDDFSLGCQECGDGIAGGRRDASLASAFDRFSTAPNAFPAMMDFALSNRCNLSCVMCNGTLSSTIRQQREHLPPMPSAYDGRFFAELREFLPHLERAHFKGGEPFLASETTRVWDEMLALGTTAEVVVTTNGTVMSDRSKRYLIDLAMHPIVSVDAVDANMLESIRVGVDARRLWCNIDEIQALVEDIGNGMTLTFCLMRRNWRELGPFLSEVQQRGLSPNVVPVNSPRSHSLRSLDRSALAKVRHELRGQRDGQNDASNDVMRIWAKVLDWIGSLSADTAGTDRGVPVLVSGANQPVEDLRRWSKATLLEVDVREEVVFAVKGSSSSVERLDAGQWVGRSARDIPGLLGAHLGVPLVLDSVAGSGGVLTAVLVPQDGSVRAPEVRGVLVSFDGANRATLHVGFR